MSDDAADIGRSAGGDRAQTAPSGDGLSPLVPPAYDRRALVPGIVHLGLGGFHRAHMARYLHDLMLADPSALQWGIRGVGLREADRPLLKALADQDCLYTLIERDGQGERQAVIGAIVETIDASADSAPLLAAIRSPETRILSLTVTEHGYCLDRATKRLDPAHPQIAHDLGRLEHPRSTIGVVVAALAGRRRGGLGGLTVLSCDNIQHNGDVLRRAVADFADAIDPRLSAWIADHASFPNSMVDRITPQPTAAAIQDFRDRSGIDDAAPLVAEPFRQWVIEDRFVAGRPTLERVGVQFVRNVAPYERMKLRLLNASHLALSGPGQLIGLTGIDETIRHPLIRRYIAALMDRETGPTLDPVPGVDLDDYKRSVVARFNNPAIPDTVARVNADAALNYLLDPIRDRLAAGAPIDLLGFALAAWLRRVRGEDEVGARIEIVHPLATELRARAIAGGGDPAPLLAMRSLFGDLGKNAAFVAVTARWLSALYDGGVERTLAGAEDDGLI
jgi:mannitol 2-dehydrogenase